jgi:hypothetical protein
MPSNISSNVPPNMSNITTYIDAGEPERTVKITDIEQKRIGLPRDVLYVKKDIGKKEGTESR